MTTHDDAVLRRKLEQHLKSNRWMTMKDMVRAAHQKKHNEDIERRTREKEIEAFEEKGIISDHLAAFIAQIKIPGEEK